MKLDNIMTLDAEGTVVSGPVADYIKSLIKTNKLRNVKTDTLGDIPAQQAVEHLLEAATTETDPDPEIQAALPEVWAQIQKDVALTKENTKSEADKKADEKAAAAVKKTEDEKVAAEKAAELAVKQGNFTVAYNDGVKLASEEFLDELKTLQSSLPEGVVVESKNGGFGLTLAEGATEETIGSAMGYIKQKEANAGALGGQLQFWTGDLMNLSVDRGIYLSTKDAAKAVSKNLEGLGFTLSPSALENYARMAKRTDISLRNPKAQTTAYLAVSNMPEPKKGSAETDEAFKVRVAAVAAKRTELQTELASGEVSTKDMKKKVDDASIELGLKKKPDNSITPGQHLLLFFHASVALEDLLGSGGTEDAVVYSDGKTEYTLTKEELEEKHDDAKANLTNYLYTNTKAKTSYADLVRGYIEKTETVVVKTSDGAKKQEEKTQVKVYPTPFWDTTPEGGEPEASSSSAPADVAAPEAAKAAAV